MSMLSAITLAILLLASCSKNASELSFHDAREALDAQKVFLSRMKQQGFRNTAHGLPHQEDTHAIYKTGQHNTIGRIQQSQLRHHQIVWHNQNCNRDEERQQHTVENSFLVFEVVIHKGKGCQHACCSLADRNHDSNVKRIPDIGQQREVM